MSFHLERKLLLLYKLADLKWLLHVIQVSCTRAFQILRVLLLLIFSLVLINNSFTALLLLSFLASGQDDLIPDENELLVMW